MSMKTPGTGRTKAYLSLGRAQQVAETLQTKMSGWQVTAEPSPEKPGAWGVRAVQDVLDINEENMGRSIGRSRFVWLKENGLMYLPTDA